MSNNVSQRKNQQHDDEEEDSKIFPQRLMEILSDEQYVESICWLPHGRAFIIRNRQLFAEQVMPRFFSRKAKYSSFTRKLNRWNFVRVSSGPELGAYYHEYFLRDKPHLAAQMFCKNARSKLAMANDTPKPSITPPSPPQEEKPVQVQSQPVERKITPMPLSAVPPAVLAALKKDSDSNGQTITAKSAPVFGISNLQLLERQIQLLQEEQAQRLLLQRLAASQMMMGNLQAPNVPTLPVPTAQPNAQAILRMKQLMDLRVRQRKGLVPSSGRASAA